MSATVAAANINLGSGNIPANVCVRLGDRPADSHPAPVRPRPDADTCRSVAHAAAPAPPPAGPSPPDRAHDPARAERRSHHAPGLRIPPPATATPEPRRAHAPPSP